MRDSLLMSTLSGPPTILYGFWHSEGSGSLPKGPVLTIPTFWFTVVNIALGALVAWSVSNLWRMGCAALFGVFYKDQLTWEESQNMVLIVNCRSALECVLSSSEILFHRRKIASSPQRSRAKLTLMVASAVAVLVVALNFGLPILVALIPTTNYGRVAPHDCGLLANDTERAAQFLKMAKASRWANAAFAAVDGYGFSSDKDSGQAPVSFPEVVPTMVNECPPNVSVCSSEYPFTFSTNYTLYREHFALNIDTPLSLQVFDTCYRPIQAGAALPNSNPNSTTHSVGYFYGPINTGDPNNIQPYTESEFLEAQYSSGYTLAQQSALAYPKPGIPLVWTPNSTLLMGGDTTFLLYFVGAVYMTDKSSDPIFGTQPDPGTPPNVAPLYNPSHIAAPIICDSKYVFCLKKGDCSPLGGANTIFDWVVQRVGMTGNDELVDIGLLLSSALNFPPIYRASMGSAAILASETTSSGVYQLMPQNVTTQKELTRLVETGMVMLSSFMQLSAVGYWDVGSGTTGLLNSTRKASICNKVVSQSTKASTIPLIPYSLLLAGLLLIVSAGGIKLIPRERLRPAYRNLLDAWTLHSPGQLHREVTERMRGRFEKVNTTTDWPTVDTYHLGPSILTRDNTKRFGTVGEEGEISTQKASTKSLSSSFISGYSSSKLTMTRDPNAAYISDVDSIPSTPQTTHSFNTMAAPTTSVPFLSYNTHTPLYPSSQR